MSLIDPTIFLPGGLVLGDSGKLEMPALNIGRSPQESKAGLFNLADYFGVSDSLVSNAHSFATAGGTGTQAALSSLSAALLTNSFFGLEHPTFAPFVGLMKNQNADPQTTKSEEIPVFSNERKRILTAKLSRSRRPSTRPASEERFWLLNKWQGQIVSVAKDSFQAQLFDLGDPTLNEQGEFWKTEVQPDDLPLVRPGTIFYWYLGFRDLPHGQRKRESIIWMRRGGRMSRPKFQRELDDVREIWKTIDVNEPSSASDAQ
jgi:hypothetical protein